MANLPTTDTTHEARPGIPLGRVGGVPVYLGKAWAIIGILVVVIFGPQIRQAVPDLGAAAYLVAAVYALLLLISVFLHEIAHAVVARRCGLTVHRIVADLWGGHTAYEAGAITPGASALVAIAGPATNGALAFLGFWVRPSITADVPYLLVTAAAFANALVALFNLLPGLPLDGGFLVEAAVWKLSGDRDTGMIAAGWCGRAVTAVFVAWMLLLPLLGGRPPDLFTVVWVFLIGAFLWSCATQAIRSGRAGRRLGRVTLAALTRPAIALPAQLPLRTIQQTVAAHLPQGGFVVLCDESGSPLGLLDSVRVNTAGWPDEMATVPGSAFLLRQPDGWVLDVDLDDTSVDVRSVAALMAERSTNFVALRGPQGQVDGVVSAADIADTLPR